VQGRGGKWGEVPVVGLVQVPWTDSVDAATVTALAQVAATQCGVFSVEQAAGVGVPLRRLARAAAAGALVRLHPKVFAMAGVPLTDVALAWAAVLQAGPGAVASHEAALAAHGLPNLVPFRPAVTVEPGRRSVYSGIEVHRYRPTSDEHATSIGGLPVTTMERAVVDLASVVSLRRLKWMVDELTMSHRVVSIGSVQRCLRQVERRGRRNIAHLQTVLDARQDDGVAPRSRTERRVDELVGRSGLPAPQKEYPVPGWELGSGFVDRAWPEVKLILEVDGRSWHAREQSMAQDRARDRAAAAEGWLVIRVLSDEVRDVPDRVLADIVAAYEARRRQLVG